MSTTEIQTTTTTTDVTGEYTIDPSHSRIGFVARHAMVTKVRGSFNQFEGSGYFDLADPTRSKIELKITAASVDTRNEDRDAHLRSGDFFATEQHPELSFVSSAVRSTGDDGYAVAGDLTIKGITKSVTIDLSYLGSAVDPYGSQRLGLEGVATINRRDWGITFNTALDAGGLLVSETITLEFDVSAIRSV